MSLEVLFDLLSKCKSKFNKKNLSYFLKLKKVSNAVTDPCYIFMDVYYIDYTCGLRDCG
jgi:hypothetical protein